MIKESTNKYIKLFREGKLSSEALSKIVRLHGKEKFIRELGRGAEGVADIVASPRFEKGIGVRKAYDPAGKFFTNRVFIKKHKTWKAVGNSSAFAKYHGKHETAPVMYHELVEGEAGINPKAGLKAIGQAWLHGKRVGDVLLHPGNIVGGKVIDFLPRNAEMYETAIMKNRARIMMKVLKGEVPTEMLVNSLPGTNAIRASAFKHVVKKEPVSPRLVYHKIKIPAAAAGTVAIIENNKKGKHDAQRNT
jgi:hypothetical protein